MIDERKLIKDTLHDFFSEMLKEQGCSDIPLIYDGENGTRPKAPFLMIGFHSTVTPGMPNFGKVEVAEDGDANLQRMTQYVRRNMIMYGFGERAIDVLETIKCLLCIDTWVDNLRKKNLVIPQTMETIESPQAFETSQENGASFDFDLTYLRVTETSPGFVTDVGIEPEFIR